MPLVEFVVLGTPVSAQGSPEAKRFWQQRVRAAAQAELAPLAVPSSDSVVLRVAYFYVYAPAADLDNIVKPIQDALTGVAYADDIQVVDLIASMRRKEVSYRVPMTAVLAAAFEAGSDFVYIAIGLASDIEVFR